MSTSRIRVLVIEDSLTIRRRLCAAVEAHPGFELVGDAEDGRRGAELCLSLRPDVVALDMMLPVMTGLEVTEFVMAWCPTPILVVSASTNRGEVLRTMDALAAGAVDVLEKPRGEEADGAWEAQFLAALRMVSRIRVITHPRARLGRRAEADGGARASPDASWNTPSALGTSPTEWGRISGANPASSPADSGRSSGAGPASFPTDSGRSFGANPASSPTHSGRSSGARGGVGGLDPRRVIAIGASTGGPAAVLRVLQALPVDVGVPVLAVIHIGSAFAAGLMSWLDQSSPLRVSFAEDRTRLDRGVGRVLLAPPDRHLVVERGLLRLSDAPELHACRPAVDALFHALAVDLGVGSAACLLTGMGRDGAEGLLAIRQAGGATIAQDEASSVVFGMPREAILRGAAEQVLPLDRIGPTLAALVRVR